MLIERPKSVVHQVSLILRERIRQRLYAPGARLPSESELTAELGVSRATIRTALTRLATEGLIIRRQGDGTYVNERIRDVNTRLGGMLDFSRLIENSGRRASIQTLDVSQRAATSPEAQALMITPDTKVLSLLRIFLADDQPAILCRNTIPMSLLAEEATSYDGDMPIHEFLSQYCHEEIAYVISEIRATIVEEELATLLPREVGSPLLELFEVFYNKNNQPLVFGMSQYDDQVLRLRLVQAWG